MPVGKKRFIKVKLMIQLQKDSTQHSTVCLVQRKDNNKQKVPLQLNIYVVNRQGINMSSEPQCVSSWLALNNVAPGQRWDVRQILILMVFVWDIRVCMWIKSLKWMKLETQTNQALCVSEGSRSAKLHINGPGHCNHLDIHPPPEVQKLLQPPRNS